MSGFTQSAKTVLKDSRNATRQRGASQATALDVLIAAIRSSPSVAAVADGIHLDWHNRGLWIRSARPPTSAGAGTRVLSSQEFLRGCASRHPFF